MTERKANPLEILADYAPRVLRFVAGFRVRATGKNEVIPDKTGQVWHSTAQWDDR